MTPSVPRRSGPTAFLCPIMERKCWTVRRPLLAVLPEIVDAVGHKLDVLLDGGVRRGADVVRACALGARAVFIGRAYLWGLAAQGETGVRDILDLFRRGILATLADLGCPSVQALDRSLLRPLPSQSHWNELGERLQQRLEDG